MASRFAPFVRSRRAIRSITFALHFVRASVVPLLSLSQKKRFLNRKFHFTQKNRHLADKTSKNTLIRIHFLAPNALLMYI